MTLEVEARPTPRFWRVTEHRALTFSYVWRGTLVSTLLNPILFLVALGVGLGTLVDDNEPAALGATSYLAFVAPALLAITAMNVAVSDGMYPVLGSVKWNPTSLGQIATPIRSIDVLVGHQLWNAIRLFATTIVFTVVIAIAGVAESWWTIATPLAGTLCGTAMFSWLAAWAVGRDDDLSFANVYRLGVIPAFLFSETYFPLDQLPVAIRPIAYITPLWYGVGLTRSLTLGTATWTGTLGYVAALLAFLGVGTTLAARAFKKRLGT